MTTPPARTTATPPASPAVVSRMDELLASRAPAIPAGDSMAVSRASIEPGRPFADAPRNFADAPRNVAETPRNFADSLRAHAETARKIERIYGPQPTDDGVIFIARGHGAHNMQIAGDFNDWNPHRTPMMRIDDDTFQVKLPLRPGRYGYRFVIDGQWRNDPANHRTEINPFGELNNVVVVAGAPVAV